QRDAPRGGGAAPAEPRRRGARRRGRGGRTMTDLGDRLLVLEQRVQQAIALIERLRAENAQLVAERAGLVERIETFTKEADSGRQREQALVRLEAEVRRLQDERQTLLGHVEGMLKELARIDLR